MMAEQDEWSSDANEAVEISILQQGVDTPKTLSTFHPKFTYPIFGEEERIFGYQGLHINLRFAAHDLQPHVEITYEKKFKTVGETKAADIEETLREWLPPSAFDKIAKFNAHIQTDTSAKDFRPPGKQVNSYTSKGKQFEIWCGDLKDPAVQRVLQRMQVFVSFFIEGGTPLNLDDQEWTIERWKVFFIYEKLSSLPTPAASPYSLVGYSTSYRFYTYTSTTPATPPSTPPKAIQPHKTHDFTLPPPTPLSPATLPCRERISQFLILPPHQSFGHGTHLYNTMTTLFLSDPTCTEITVEDPNEAFDDLRDFCDHTRLTSTGVLSRITLNTTPNTLTSTTTTTTGSKRPPTRRGLVPTSALLDLSLLSALRRTAKLAPRQFARLVELHLLSRIPPSHRQSTARLTRRGRATDENDRAYYWWRLLVKQRIYRKHRDQLMQLDRLERIDKLEETVGTLQGDYERLLRALQGRQVGGDEGEGEGSAGTNGGEKRGRAKRKVVDEDEDDDDEVGDGETTLAKRPKT